MIIHVEVLVDEISPPSFIVQEARADLSRCIGLWRTLELKWKGYVSVIHAVNPALSNQAIELLKNVHVIFSSIIADGVSQVCVHKLLEVVLRVG
jgi:hypothetical protein